MGQEGAGDAGISSASHAPRQHLAESRRGLSAVLGATGLTDGFDWDTVPGSWALWWDEAQLRRCCRP